MFQILSILFFFNFYVVFQHLSHLSRRDECAIFCKRITILHKHFL